MLTKMVTVEVNHKKIALLLSAKQIDKIIKLLYPAGTEGNSKGYIELVNFFYGKS